MKIKIVLITLMCAWIIPTQAQWKSVFNKKSGQQVHPVFCYGNSVLAVDDDGMYLSLDSGNHWKLIDSTAGMQVVLHIIKKDSLLLAASMDSGIYTSHDSGRVWEAPKTWPYKHKSTLYDIVQSGDNLIGTIENVKMIVSKDNGQTWDTATKGLYPAPNHYYEAWGLITIGNTTLVQYSNYMYATYDHGETWNYLGMCPDVRNGATLSFYEKALMGENSISESIDTGKTWNSKYKLSSGLDIITGFCTNGKAIFASTANGNEGVLMSTDSGNTWVSINTGLSTLNLYSISIDSNFLYVGAKLGQIFRRSLGEITSVQNISSRTLQELIKLKVYPNPLHDVATFDFGRELNQGMISVYDIAGKQVFNLNNVNSPRYELQCGNLSKGTYLYVISEKQKFLATGKLQIQ